ncbi:MAG: rRNA maturation RNase YbeY [Chlorobi bacterium]|nr:rRNA maturation RNase YbeY [Chlorobiota bacterium]
MEINYFYEDINEFELSETISEWINKTITNENKETGEINIIFCSDEYLLKMNKEHLNHDYYTDIITFDYCQGSLVSGDLFISVDRVGENAKDFNVDFKNELNRVIIHGVLHLIGYNDKTDDEQKEMTEKENFYLNLLFNS